MNIKDGKNLNAIVRQCGVLLVIMVVTLSITYAAKTESTTMSNDNKVVNAPKTKLELSKDDLVIAGLNQTMGREKMLALLGKAKTTEHFILDYFAGGKNVKFTKYNYPGVSVVVVDENGRIIEIDTTDITYKTARGIKIGDTVTKVKEVYGEEDLHSPSRMGEPFYNYTKAKSPEVLSFKVDPATNKVIKISVDSWSD